MVIIEHIKAHGVPIKQKAILELGDQQVDIITSIGHESFLCVGEIFFYLSIIVADEGDFTPK